MEAYRGEGIQHIALGTDDIFACVETLRSNAIQFMDTPDSYYGAIDKRVPNHGEVVQRLKRNRILIDGRITSYNVCYTKLLRNQ